MTLISTRGQTKIEKKLTSKVIWLMRLYLKGLSLQIFQEGIDSPLVKLRLDLESDSQSLHDKRTTWLLKSTSTFKKTLVISLFLLMLFSSKYTLLSTQTQGTEGRFQPLSLIILGFTLKSPKRLQRCLSKQINQWVLGLQDLKILTGSLIALQGGGLTL